VKLSYTKRAKIDIDIAVGWYESQRKGLGLEFLECIEVTINRIVENPKLYSVKHRRFRSAVTRKFPFSIFYTIEKSEVVVHAVFDNRQDPVRTPDKGIGHID
jgi:plasmid stabilization system protein ParE